MIKLFLIILMISFIGISISSPSYSKSRTIKNIAMHTIHVQSKDGHKRLPPNACVYVPDSQFPVNVLRRGRSITRCKKPGDYIIILDAFTSSYNCTGGVRAHRCRHLDY